MIAMIVQRPNILDILEIESNRSSAICYRLEMVKFKLQDVLPHDPAGLGLIW